MFWDYKVKPMGFFKIKKGIMSKEARSPRSFLKISPAQSSKVSQILQFIGMTSHTFNFEVIKIK